MSSRIGYFEILSSNPARDISFYKNVFGWMFFKEFELPIEYYRIETGNINGGLLKRRHEAPQSNSSTNAFVCSIEVDNFDHYSKLITDNGGTIFMNKFAVVNKCWQGYFLDLNNNHLGIFQVDVNAK